MTIIPIILDSRPAYLNGGPPMLSLLSLPVGTGTLMDEMASWTRSTGAAPLHILPTFSRTSQYEAFLLNDAPAGTCLVGPEALSELAHEYEPSDVAFIFDPRCWPVDGWDLNTIVRESHGTRWAAHGVVVASSPEGTLEIAHCDDQGRVRRIRRYYDQVTLTRIEAVSYCVVPLTGVEGLRLETLAGLRAALSARGVLSRDVPIDAGIIDLSEEAGLLTLNEQAAIAAVDNLNDKVYRPAGRQVLVGRDCRLHPTARLVGPVIIQHGVTIDEGATVLGPSVVGPHGRLGQGCLVAQAVLAGHSTVAPGSVIRHRVAAGDCADDDDRQAGTESRETAPYAPAQSQGIRLGADASAIREVDRRRSLYPSIKLGADIVIALVSLLVLAPLLGILAVLIKLDSKGPVLFGHEREGLNGNPFRCLKFRTMSRDAHQRQRELYSTNSLDGPQFKLDHDPRITRIGAWLRATNLDELPQLINVLRGEMSLVGPRPSPFRENQICVPWRRARLSVRPGITGLWQICRDQRRAGDFHQWIAYDIMYVRHLSLVVDVKILLATVLTLGGTWSVPATWIVGAPQASHLRREAMAVESSGHSNT